MTYDVRDHDDHTHLSLVRTGFEPAGNQENSPIEEFDAGWPFFLSNLKSVIERGVDRRSSDMGQRVSA